MRKLVLKMSISIDGFVSGLKGEIDWIFKNRDPKATEWTVSQLSKAGAHLMGRKTFQDMAAYWPSSNEPFARPMNKIPKIAFSRQGFDPKAVCTEHAKTWADALVLTGDLLEDIITLKKQPGNDLVAHGGASFAQSLIQTGQIDEYWLPVHPVILGQGLPLFSELKTSLALELISSQTFNSGVVANIYRARK